MNTPSNTNTPTILLPHPSRPLSSYLTIPHTPHITPHHPTPLQVTFFAAAACVTTFLFFQTHGWMLGTIYSALCYFMVFRHCLQSSLADHAWRAGDPPVCTSTNITHSHSPISVFNTLNSLHVPHAYLCSNSSHLPLHSTTPSHN